MSFKKMLIKGLAVAVVSMPLLANAGIDLSKAPEKLASYNYTNEDSTVKVSGICAGPTRFTPHINADGTPGYSGTAWTAVRMICLGAEKCKAEIYMNKDCRGTDVVATATLTLSTGEITVESSSDKYEVSSGGLGIVYLHYKK